MFGEHFSDFSLLRPGMRHAFLVFMMEETHTRTVPTFLILFSIVVLFLINVHTHAVPSGPEPQAHTSSSITLSR